MGTVSPRCPFRGTTGTVPVVSRRTTNSNDRIPNEVTPEADASGTVSPRCPFRGTTGTVPLASPGGILRSSKEVTQNAYDRIHVLLHRYHPRRPH